MADIEARIIVRGRVTGVGFRSLLQREAYNRHLKGWVRNREDRGVEAVLQGPEGGVQAVIEWAKTGPRGAIVENVEVTQNPTLEDFGPEFEVRP
jgi:acylphosphatase